MAYKEKYRHAIAEVVLFDNTDMIRTSGGSEENTGGGCKNNGQDNGNGCSGNSGNCPGGFWK